MLALGSSLTVEPAASLVRLAIRAGARVVLVNQGGLELPHPRAHQRAFVLAPWHAAHPQAQVPGLGSVEELLARAADREGLRPGPAIEGFGIS